MKRGVTNLDFQNEVSFDVLHTDESSEAHLKNDAAVSLRKFHKLESLGYA